MTTVSYLRATVNGRPVDRRFTLASQLPFTATTPVLAKDAVDSVSETPLSPTSSRARRSTYHRPRKLFGFLFYSVTSSVIAASTIGIVAILTDL
ncbi:hypothetical protein [Herbiconiux sp. L3-i23]|uniref:hypothetical protein n=1 Tax=Herbiconiux sp. L3-i23 TaxID=2905871 RepID=UPI002061675D|nr:hypothetical protein [Herbiconiux sp. L3-i23]BDI23766.1 hypothetical protein L3i23_25420 [Herbiconiux sp. L3-i23]